MMRTRGILLVNGSVGVTLALLYYYDVLWTLLSLLLHAVVCVIGVYLTVSWSLVRGKQYKPVSRPPVSKVAHDLLQKMIEKRSERTGEVKKVVVITRNIDIAIQEVIDLVVRDYILTWYTDLSKDQDTFTNSFRSDMWVMIENFSVRLARIDQMKFFTKDLVEILHRHFKTIRHYTKRPDQEVTPVFILQPWLENDQMETDFLRKVCEAMLGLLMPKEYRRCSIIRKMLREILTTAVLKPTVDMICDPDYINQKLIGYIDYRRQLSEDTRRTYTYAETYEDFVKMIQKCTDIEHLKQIRYNIITEIIHATTIQNLKEQDIDSGERGGKSQERGAQKTAKGDLLRTRNLKRYINNLKVAKVKSEKRIHSLGGPEYKSYDTTEESDIVTLGSKKKQHQLGKEIFDKYIVSSSSSVKLDRSTVKGMESYVLGNTGPEAFEDGQTQICMVLKQTYYPSFIVSDIYHRYRLNIEEGASGPMTRRNKDQMFFEPDDDDDIDSQSSDTTDDSDIFRNQSYIAQQKLEQLDDKIHNKDHALKALRQSRKPDDTKSEKVEKDLERESENLKLERRQLEAHILRTQTWCENQGMWRAHVYEAQIVEEDEKKLPVFVLIIHLAGREKSHNLQHSSEGWVVTRTLPEFHAAHLKLVEIGPWLKKKELPSVGRFKTVDEKFLAEAKNILNDYLNAIMKDGLMAQSEALYSFLTPTPEYFKQKTLEKKPGFSFANLLKSFPLIQDKADTDGELKLVDEDDEVSKLDKTKDSIAEPFYKLVNEVFECKGMFKWVRRSFITFVEVTFGRSINRQLRETVDWVFSESMIIYYITMFKNSVWPQGQLAPSLPLRSDSQKLQTRMEAKEKFLQNMPDAVKNLLGEENGRRGTIKIFEVLQDVRLNKHLFYIILEHLLAEVFPEIHDK
ncbi:hypothetical protein FSP39_003500 [Pinctada imbricata]|uniref:Sorting nexin-25 n=1 Tax=Pinctada imbricata TaxID=66713 RepID=A0AA88YH62_PINIB|nr:hypothetical protein FSP39_003500 [Pinctada imbricata]